MDSIPITFKEIIPDHNAPEKWREIVLNTGGTHSTLQDIKLPQRAGGYCYEDSKHPNTRNRFIYWQTTPDSIELSEASLDRNLSGAHLRCRVAAGTPPLHVSVWERARDVVVLAATVSSVHRLHFPRPLTLEDKASFGANGPSLSIFHDATTAVANSPANYFILPQYSTTSGAVAHACASLLRASGEAVWALAWRRGAGAGDAAGGLAVARLPAAGAGAPTLQHLRRESAVPRFLSGITGALRGKGSGDSVETSGVVVAREGVVAVCADTCLRVWSAEDGGAPLAVSPPLAVEPSPHAQGHRLQRSAAADGALVLVAYLSSPSESEFVVTRVERDHAGVRFTNICRLYGAQLELVEYRVGAGEGIAIWALWSRPDGDSLITTSSLGADVEWRAVAAREPPAALPALPSHQAYRDRLFAPGLFPVAVIKKALAIYRRTWGGGAGVGGGGLDSSGAGLGEGDVREAALTAVQARLAHLAARPNTNQSHLMHRCWSDLYSWCVQYMEGLQKPLGLMVSKHEESGWWCGVVRRGGVSFVRALSHLERLLLAPDLPHTNTYEGVEELSGEARAVLAAGARWERWLGDAADELERRLFSCAAPQHRLLPRLLHLLCAPPDDAPPTLTPQNIDDLTAMLEPIQDLQKAVLELNEVLKLEVPNLDLSNSEDAEHDSEYDTLFSSDLGVSVLTEAIRQMAEMRRRMVRGVVGALVAARGADGVPGAGHCVVHWQAYRALLWLRSATLQTQQSSHSDEQFRLKLSVLGVEGAAVRGGAGGAAGGYAAGAGGARARRHLAAARAPLAWHAALPLMAHHLAHQMWAVSGGFEFGWWLASINQPKLVQSYVALLEPWCEWNACSRQFILGMSLLDTGDAEGAYAAFCKAAKGVSGGEPLLQRLVRGAVPPATPHRALVLYYLHVIRLFEIHDAGACVVRLAETAISIADRDDPNLAMFQWLVFKWHLAGGRVERALCAAAANPAQHARANAAATLLTTLAGRKQLGALVGCAALAAEAERAAAARAKLHDAHAHNPYYSFLYALHVARSDYRKAGAVMYERAARCAAEGGGARRRRRCLLAALTCLRLARPEHAFLTRPAGPDAPMLVLRPEDLARELRELDAQHADTRHNVETLLPEGDNIDFEELRQKLKNANAEALHIVAKRLLSSEQFLPHWLLTQYMEVDSGGCVRTLLASGRAVEAAQAAARCVRATLRTRMTAAHAAPPCCPLAAVDLLRAELRDHRQDARAREAYEDLEAVVEEYMKVVTRTSDAMKQARIQFPVAS